VNAPSVTEEDKALPYIYFENICYIFSHVCFIGVEAETIVFKQE